MVGKLDLRPGDEIELRAADFSWNARQLVVSVVRSSRTVATKLERAPTFLLSNADRSFDHLMEQINQLEADHKLMKVSRSEYEQRSRLLQSLRDNNKYPTPWLVSKMTELNRARDLGLLTSQQHDIAIHNSLRSWVQTRQTRRTTCSAQAPLPPRWPAQRHPEKVAKKTKPVTLVN